jgi:hypothetical protein
MKTVTLEVAEITVSIRHGDEVVTLPAQWIEVTYRCVGERLAVECWYPSSPHPYVKMVHEREWLRAGGTPPAPVSEDEFILRFDEINKPVALVLPKRRLNRIIINKIYDLSV